MRRQTQWRRSERPKGHSVRGPPVQDATGTPAKWRRPRPHVAAGRAPPHRSVTLRGAGPRRTPRRSPRNSAQLPLSEDQRIRTRTIHGLDVPVWALESRVHRGARIGPAAANERSGLAWHLLMVAKQDRRRSRHGNACSADVDRRAPTNGADPNPDWSCGAERGHGHAARRERNRQGGGGPVDTRLLRPRWRAVRGRELRGHRNRVAGVRAVRP